MVRSKYDDDLVVIDVHLHRFVRARSSERLSVCLSVRLSFLRVYLFVRARPSTCSQMRLRANEATDRRGP